MKKIVFFIGCLGAIFGCKEDFDHQFVLDTPPNQLVNFNDDVLFNKEFPSNSTTSIKEDGTYGFVVNLAEKTIEDTRISLNLADLEKNVSEYNQFKGVSDFELLPEDFYTFNSQEIKKGEKSGEIKLTLKNYSDLPQGEYVLPLLVNVGDKKLLHTILVNKDAFFTPLSETNKKPMPTATYSCPERTEPMKMVAYVETNDWDIRNMGQFLLKDSKKPIFDMVIMFAANMNYDAQSDRRILHFNDQLQPIIKNPEKYIKPLKDRGIKVLADILPNHQGVGYLNFQSYDEALDFARQCKEIADKTGIDGWDIDEEYADYHMLRSKPQKGAQSVLWLMRAMKEVMPDKLLTMYDYSLYVSGYTDDQGKQAKDYIDYSWTDYGRTHASTINLPKHKYGTQSIEFGQGQFRNTTQAAQANLNECYGILMLFNIRGEWIRDRKSTIENYLSQATTRFYGEETIFEGKYHKGPKG